VTLSAEQEATLRAALGAAAIEAGGDAGLEGVAPCATLHPGDAPALARAVGALAACGLAALVRGGGTHMQLGNPPRRADVVLSTRRVAGVLDFDPGEGVCRVAAGTPLQTLRAEVNAGGWELPLDPPGQGSTVGGALAAAAIGPRALGFGLPRDLVLGLDVVLADGTPTRCGGRVVKNVTGYDLAKLYTGSLGTLGVIAAAWLRLRPRPERVLVMEATLAGVDAALALGLAAARLASARAAALEIAPGGAARLVVELAGDEPVVEGDCAWLAAKAGAGERTSAALDGLRRLQAEGTGPGVLHFRVSFRPSLAGRVAARLAAAGASLLFYPGLGLAWASFREGGGEAAGPAFEEVSAAAREAEGSWLLERAPRAARAGRDAFGDAARFAPLTRALKARFDPGGLLNPGRQLGHT
jgi:glycolate dehydrogenase FAD-binding subunit